MPTPIANSLTASGLLNRLLNPSQDKADANAQSGQTTAANNALDNFLKQNSASGVDYTPSANSALRAGYLQSSQQAFAYSESMSLQLTTQEGDKISVDFRQMFAAYQSYKEMQYAEQNGESPQGFALYESKEAMQMAAFEQRFAMSIDGDLNENELKAVFDVFEQVDSVANQFYGGNLEQALQSAVNMEIDFGQLQNVSLNLTQSAAVSSRQQQAAMAEYGANSAQNQQESVDTGAVEQLPDYYQKWQAALEALDQWFTDSQGVWDQLTGKVAAQRFPEQDSAQGWLQRVQDFHQRFADYVQAGQNVGVAADTEVNADSDAKVE